MVYIYSPLISNYCLFQNNFKVFKMSSKQFVSISLGNKALSININISELSKVGGNLNISLNDLTSLIEASQAQTTPVVVAKVLDESRNVTMRKKPKVRAKKQLIIEESDEEIVTKPPKKTEKEIDDLIDSLSISSDDEPEYVPLCKPITSRKNKDKYKSKYDMDDEENYLCPHCSFKTQKMNTLSMHIAATHASEHKYVCEAPNCGKRFPILTRLQHHIKNHHDIEHLQCPFPNCEYADAKNKQTLYTHYVRRHMDYETMCSQKGRCYGCDKEKNASIYYHLATCNKSSPFYKPSSQSSSKK